MQRMVGFIFLLECYWISFSLIFLVLAQIILTPNEMNLILQLIFLLQKVDDDGHLKWTKLHDNFWLQN